MEHGYMEQQNGLFVEEEIAHASYRSEQSQAAAIIRQLVQTPSPAGKLMRFALDVASDEYIANEFYQSHPELMSFLVQCGASDREVMFRDYLTRHQEILHCRKKGCSGTLMGGCPVVVCDTCGTKHFVEVDRLSKEMCSQCAAQKLGECDPETRRRMHTIYCVYDEEIIH